MKTPHKHAELIKAWADGAEIEYFLKHYDQWITTSNPAWLLRDKYRIKPEPKPDVVRWCVATFGMGYEEYTERANLKVTFDGKTGKLKSAEVIA